MTSPITFSAEETAQLEELARTLEEGAYYDEDEEARFFDQDWSYFENAQDGFNPSPTTLS